MILQEGKKKNSYIIEGLFLPLQTEKRLEALGMTKGTPVEVLNRKRSGTMIVRVRGTRFALGRGITGKIEVAEDKKQLVKIWWLVLLAIQIVEKQRCLTLLPVPI